jgi:hypothetical protein
VTVVRRYSNGTLEVPVRVEGPGGAIGDGVQRIGPDHPDYADWQRSIREGMVDVEEAGDSDD